MNVLIPIENDKNADKVALLDVTSVNVEVFNKTTYVSFIVKDSMRVYKYTKGVISVNELVKNQFIDLTTDWVKVDSIEDERNNFYKNEKVLAAFRAVLSKAPSVVFLRLLTKDEKVLFTAIMSKDVSVITSAPNASLDALLVKLENAAIEYNEYCAHIRRLRKMVISKINSLLPQLPHHKLSAKNFDNYLVRLILNNDYYTLSYYSEESIEAAVETFIKSSRI